MSRHRLCVCQVTALEDFRHGHVFLLDTPYRHGSHVPVSVELEKHEEQKALGRFLAERHSLLCFRKFPLSGWVFLAGNCQPNDLQGPEKWLNSQREEEKDTLVSCSGACILCLGRRRCSEGLLQGEK